MFGRDDAIDDDAELMLPVSAGGVPAPPVAAGCVDVCVVVCAVPEAGSCEAYPPARPDAPSPDVVEDDDAAEEFAAGEVASAAAALSPVTVMAVVRVGVASESAFEDVEDAGPAEDEVVSFFAEAVVPPVPPASPDPPEAPAG